MFYDIILKTPSCILRWWQTRTQCCGHIVADTNVSPFARAQHLLQTQNLCPGHKNVSDFFQKHFVSATNVSQFAQNRNNHEQQCVRNIVSSFATTLRETFLCLGHKFWVRNKCCPRGQTGKHLCPQQCVHDTVSSFATTFRLKTTPDHSLLEQNAPNVRRNISF